MEGGRQPVRLLPVQGGELAQVLTGGGLEGVCVAVQFLLAVRQMHQRDHREHHPLVTGGEIIQHFPAVVRWFPSSETHDAGLWTPGLSICQ